jgi:3-carboxy-cis,cis-muconate cycloisomerase
LLPPPSTKMPLSALDSRLFRDLFGTQEIRAVFDDEAYTRQMIHVEVALARAQSKAGVIPSGAGESLTKKLAEESFR